MKVLFNLTVEHFHGAPIIGVEGEVDITNAEKFLRFCSEQLGDSRILIIDFTKCTFLDSTALGILVSFQKKLREQGKVILIFNDPDLRRIFEITGLERIFVIVKTAEESRDEARKWEVKC